MRREPWKSYVKELVKLYPYLKKKLNTPLEPRITASYGERGSGLHTSPVERAVIHNLPPDEQRVYDAISNAILITKQLSNGELRVKLIDLVYWKQACNIHGASIKLHCHINSAVKYNCDFLRLVARLLELPMVVDINTIKTSY